MSNLETFGWYTWIVRDSRDQIAIVELAPCVSKFSARKLRKMVRKIGSDQVHEETGIRWPGDSRYDDGAWEIILIDQRYEFVFRVVRKHEDGVPSILLVPGTCRATAVEIARAIAQALGEPDASDIETDGSIEIKFDDGTELVFLPELIGKCLDGVEFSLGDGSSLSNLWVLDTGTYVADSRTYIT